MFRFIVICLLVAAVSAFVAPGASAPARMSMLFNFGKKAAPKAPAEPAPAPKGKSVFKGGKAAAPAKPAAKGWKSGQTANKGTYVPEGLSAAQYEKLQAEQKAAADKKKQKFPRGKEPETLTEWILKEKAKGNEGKALLKNHRMVKTKYEGWYTDESPV